MSTNDKRFTFSAEFSARMLELFRLKGEELQKAIEAAAPIAAREVEEAKARNMEAWRKMGVATVLGQLPTSYVGGLVKELLPMPDMFKTNPFKPRGFEAYLKDYALCGAAQCIDMVEFRNRLKLVRELNCIKRVKNNLK